MGCDIHTRVEYLDRNGNWQDGDFYRRNPYFGSYPGEDPYTVVGLCEGRNYSLFATLANVRNYGGTPYIDAPRGIPDDACESTAYDYGRWGEDAHSASHFTLRELIEWNDNAPKLRHSGMVSAEDAVKLDAGEGTPETWCQWTSMDGWVYREWEEDVKVLDHLIEELVKRGEDLWLWYNEKMARERADQLRIVFWFDN